jgi:hypothetical protein
MVLEKGGRNHKKHSAPKPQPNVAANNANNANGAPEPFDAPFALFALFAAKKLCQKS